jgi:aryl-phospho-beta-D-glucosidase BglC (GH1 family)
MDLLRVDNGKIVDSEGRPVVLRGTCIGGWMNLENFINGFTGSERGLRAAFTEILGESKAHFFFERLLHHFFSEEDVKFIRETGVNVVRLPVNYRHFEDDGSPFTYKEEGFQRLDRAIDWCRASGLYAILDLHSAAGCQNGDWHCDNSSRQALFWAHPHFQDRFASLWGEFARRYRGNPTVAGYNVMNEPCTGAVYGLFGPRTPSHWEALNGLYRRVVGAIREQDSDHIIFLEGDVYSVRFHGLEAPFEANLAYSSHNYSYAGLGPGRYPGRARGRLWDRQRLLDQFIHHEGTQFCREHGVPLWSGEFGATYNGPKRQRPFRLRALDDQIGIFEEHGVHWTTWTYKDVGVMGWVYIDPESRYMALLRAFLRAKSELATDYWMEWLAPTRTRRRLSRFSRRIRRTVGDPEIHPSSHQRYFHQAALSVYLGALMQPTMARCFLDLTEEEIDSALQSFSLKNCRRNEGLLAIVKKYSQP